jgi:hypothetical protein
MITPKASASSQNGCFISITETIRIVPLIQIAVYSENSMKPEMQSPLMLKEVVHFVTSTLKGYRVELETACPTQSVMLSGNCTLRSATLKRGVKYKHHIKVSLFLNTHRRVLHTERLGDRPYASPHKHTRQIICRKPLQTELSVLTFVQVLSPPRSADDSLAATSPYRMFGDFSRTAWKR